MRLFIRPACSIINCNVNARVKAAGIFFRHLENQDMIKHQHGRVRLTVSYGYDIHSVEVLARTWLQIQGGVALTVQGQGFSVEGEFSQDEWAFNAHAQGSLQVTAEGARDIFDGMLTDVTVESL